MSTDPTPLDPLLYALEQAHLNYELASGIEVKYRTEDLEVARQAIRDAFAARLRESKATPAPAREGEATVIWALVNEYGAVTNPTPVEPAPGNPWENHRQWRYRKFVLASPPAPTSEVREVVDLEVSCAFSAGMEFQSKRPGDVDFHGRPYDNAWAQGRKAEVTNRILAQVSTPSAPLTEGAPTCEPVDKTEYLSGPGPDGYADPSEEDLNDPLFEAIWQRIKAWDVNVPTRYAGYTHCTGNHVMAILSAVRAVKAGEVEDGPRPGGGEASPRSVEGGK